MHADCRTLLIRNSPEKLCGGIILYDRVIDKIDRFDCICRNEILELLQLGNRYRRMAFALERLIPVKFLFRVY